MLPTALSHTSQSRTGAYQHWLTWQSHFLCSVEEFPSWWQMHFKDTPAGLGTLSGALGGTDPTSLLRSRWTPSQSEFGDLRGVSREGGWREWSEGGLRSIFEGHLVIFFPPYPLNSVINSFFKKKDLLNHHLVIHLLQNHCPWVRIFRWSSPLLRIC